MFGPAVPVHLLDPDRPVLDRRFKRITYEKNQNLMNVVFLYREQLVCLFACLCVSEIYPKKESSKKKWFTKKSFKPKT